jgi:hypothetical protein
MDNILNSTSTVAISLYKNDTSFTSTTNIMMVIGSQVIPYGTGTNYKIPVTSAGQTQNIILSEPLRKIGNYADSVNSEGVVTRRIKKYEITGTEDWDITATGILYFTPNASYNYARGLGYITYICSHYPCYEQVRVAEDIPNGYIAFAGISDARIYIHDSNYATVSGYTTWLAQQYTNGTPVIVYYVLTTPTTESVTAPTIPTSSGFSNIEIGTSLAPSKFTYDLGKMFMPQVEKVRQNGEWV